MVQRSRPTVALTGGYPHSSRYQASRPQRVRATFNYALQRPHYPPIHCMNEF